MNLMDDPNVQQTVHNFGDGNFTAIAGRDLYITTSPPPPDPRPSTPPRAPRRRPGKYASGGLFAAVVSLVFAATMLDRPPSPPSVWPEGKTALCKDGEYSPSRHRSGTCSRHGGVVYWRFAADDPFWRQ
jgi:hypothetical protein